MTETISTGKNGATTWGTELQFVDEEYEGNPVFTPVRELRRTPKGRAYLVNKGVSMKGYAYGGNPEREYSAIPFTERRFVSWDGEGDPRKSTYYLFGNSDGDHVAAPSLSTVDCLSLIISKADKDAIHFGFAFGYDVNMILGDLSKNHLRVLHETNSVCWKRWRIEHIPRKWFVVTDRVVKRTVKIWDVWSFFMTSALKAWEQYGVEISDAVRIGKELRGDRGYEDIAEDMQYWHEENQAYVELMNKLRQSLHAADLYISAWHGPGAIASYSLKKHKIDLAMAECPEPVNTAAQYAYGGGRFELLKIGRASCKVYEYDINSAYPFAISQLPNLARGTWIHRDHADIRDISRFGIYRITLNRNPFENANIVKPMPFLFRDEQGLISYPCVMETWVWSPELWGMQNISGLTIHEGWEFVEEDLDDRPFAWLAENYATRKRYKREGNQAQHALKLQMNSIYGKQAQRVGWERRQTSPKWHQIEWAGWVTSYCRAMVFRAGVMAGDALIAFETDAVFSTKRLASRLDIGDNLGQWEETVYDDFVYLQSGCRFGLVGDKWQAKYRGFDPGSLSLDDALTVLGRDPEEWVIHGTTKRFIGYAQALSQNFALWRHFETEKRRDLVIGGEGKRRHNPKLCPQCVEGIPANQRLHVCTISQPVRGMSTKHHLPWLDLELLDDQVQRDEFRRTQFIENEQSAYIERDE